MNEKCVHKSVTCVRWQQTGDIYGQSTLRCGNRLVAPSCAGLIIPYPPHGPSGTMGSPQYKDGTSMAALELNIASGSLLQ